ncbi:Na+/H+ antiporter subunit C [Pontibacter harenae]|uniref:Na+/H+ antiporter subunit C n=1 Tax=Pontibacter harenae TaxID=2894083 RepID=UPI001E286D94|nr:Na+/H+ antiporter subunit C [Pontibacter harenae]MCC9167114.1 Na+/H+ antiporter subunit C [Pontibacter harenae]
MDLIFTVAVGLLFAASLYLILHRHLFKLIVGLMIFGLASNLYVFAIGRLTREKSAIIPSDAEIALEPFADPVPQALILTAIVIGFGLQAFAIVLVKRLYQVAGTDDIDELNNTDKIDSTEK